MPQRFIGRWLGDVRGSLVGNAYLFVPNLNEITLHIRAEGQTVVYNCEFTAEPPFQLNMIPNAESNADGRVGPAGFIIFDKIAENAISGSWITEDGSAGVVGFSRYQGDADPQTTPESVQHISNEEVLGTVTIYKDELSAIVGKMREIFDGRIEPLITAEIDDHTLTVPANDFLSREDLPAKIHSMTVGIYDSSQAVRRSAKIILEKKSDNKIIVEAEDEMWVAGVKSTLSKFVNRYSRRGLYVFRKYGLNHSTRLNRIKP
jgi:hypothetical protein